MLIRSKRPALSAHQKQMRFLTGLALALTIIFAVLFFWLINLAASPAFLASGRLSGIDSVSADQSRLILFSFPRFSGFRLLNSFFFCPLFTHG